ncbi:alpha/beta fold hydrolase [Streptomyces sp. NPDC054797]
MLEQLGGIMPPEEIDEMLRRRPETAALSVPGTGHDVHLERPDALWHVLREFLGEVTRSAINHRA